MPRLLPPYETLVRWSVKEVTDWLKEVNLTDFKDTFTKNNIDGSRLTKLTEFDVSNFIGKQKKKTELKMFLEGIQKPRAQQTKPTWIAPVPRKPQRPQVNNSHKNDTDSDNDSIYSWGDDFSDEEDGTKQNKVPHNNQEPEDNYIDPNDNDQDYLFPVDKNDTQRPLPPTPQRRPEPIPTPLLPGQQQATPTPLLPGQKRDLPSTKKNIPKPPISSTKKNIPKPPSISGQDVYDNPDDIPPVKAGRRPPPPVPSTEPEQEELYINDVVNHSNNAPQHTDSNDDGYIKFQPAAITTVKHHSNQSDRPIRISVPTFPDSNQVSETKRKFSLPPIPPSKSPTVPAVQAPTPPEDDEDGFSRYDWYHHNADRTESEKGLMQHMHNGMYLVRKSLKGGKVHPYTLMLFYETRVFNFPVRRQGSCFALGKEKKDDDLSFNTVPALIEYFQTTRMILNPTKQGWATTLTLPLEKTKIKN